MLVPWYKIPCISPYTFFVLFLVLLLKRVFLVPQNFEIEDKIFNFDPFCRWWMSKNKNSSCSIYSRVNSVLFMKAIFKQHLCKGMMLLYLSKMRIVLTTTDEDALWKSLRYELIIKPVVHSILLVLFTIKCI